MDSPPNLPDRYQLQKRLGQGNTGAVWQATDTYMQRDVAVKVLHTHHTGTAIERFRREAQFARIVHDHVITIFDKGVGSDGLDAYIVMELLPGPTLSALIKERRRLAFDEAGPIFAPVASGLAAVHRAGAVHRDVKPSNLMFNGQQHLKLLDFGLAVVIAGDGTRLTQSGAIHGTPAYMSPEQASGARVGTPSDVYSFGCVLYEVLSGTRPYHGADSYALARSHIGAPVPNLSDSTNVPSHVARLVRSMMAKDPAHRPTANEVHTSLAVGVTSSQVTAAWMPTDEPETLPTTKMATRVRVRLAPASGLPTEPFAADSDGFDLPVEYEHAAVVAALKSWATRRRWVDPNYFDDLTLTVTTERVAEFRLADYRRQTRRVRRVTATRPILPTTTGEPDLPHPTSPTQTEHEEFMLEERGGPRTSGCRTCGGKKTIPCPSTVACTRCAGTGNRVGDHGGPNKVRDVCVACEGRRKVRCPTCDGSSSLPCPTCEGSGKQYAYTAVIVDGGAKHFPARRVAANRWLPLLQSDFGAWQYAPISEVSRLADVEVRAVDRILRHGSSRATRTMYGRPIARALQARFTTVTTARYHADGKSRIAWIIGQNERVIAPGVQTRAWLLDGGILLVIALLILVVLIASGGR